MTSEKLDIRMPPELIAAAKARGENLSEGVRSCVTRYLYLLERGRSDLRVLLTDDEKIVLVRLGNATAFRDDSLEALAWNIEDAYDYEAGCSEDERLALVAKLHGLSLHHHAALVDAVERFWRANSLGVPVDPVRMLDEPAGKE